MENAERRIEQLPLRSLIEKIIEKKSISPEEQKEVNSLALSGIPVNREDFDAIGRLTELICSGEIAVPDA